MKSIVDLSNCYLSHIFVNVVKMRHKPFLKIRSPCILAFTKLSSISVQCPKGSHLSLGKCCPMDFVNVKGKGICCPKGQVPVGPSKCCPKGTKLFQGQCCPPGTKIISKGSCTTPPTVPPTIPPVKITTTTTTITKKPKRKLYLTSR
jgi:hypothetical protein